MVELESPRPSAYVWAALGVGLTTGFALGVRQLGLPEPEMLYLLAIMVAAAWLGRGPSVLAAALSVAAYDFFFVPPFHQFTVAESRYLLTFLMMFGVGIVISSLTIRIRRQERAAALREARTASLYALSRDLGGAVDAAEIAAAAARHVLQALRAGAVRVQRQDGTLLGAAPATAPPESEARWKVTIAAGSHVLGELVVVPRPPAAPTAEQLGFAEAVARQVGIALERTRLVDESKAIALRARAEELRSALLSAVSHDLRTPLASIGGTLGFLRDEVDLPAGTRAELLDGAAEEAERLERLVTNLLEMSRLQSGAAQVRREWLPLEEVVGAARNRLETQLAAREVRTSLPDDLPLVAVDAVLIGQVLVNLLDNAAKYTPAGTPIELAAVARSAPPAVELTVADRGPGFAAGDEERIFERFFRAQPALAGGSGLGLAICRGIVEAHGGTITAERRPGGGALFRIVLPIVGTPPASPPVELEEAEVERAHG